jgi:hypothetical protein
MKVGMLPVKVKDILKTPVFTVETIKNDRCVRCGGVLELRDMKYEPDLSDALGSIFYLNCVFCGQDYYANEKGVCELVRSGA